MEDILVDGEKIKQLRLKRHWTQKELSLVAGIDQAVISKLENNSKEDTRMQTMVALARAFRVPTDELFVPAEPVPVEPTDPQIDVMMGLVEDMTPAERQSAEMFIRFVLAQRKKQSKRRPQKG